METVTTPTRDKTIDYLRGLAMFWVIVVYVLYWGKFSASKQVNLAQSFCLFEMPLFFFITGASNSFSTTAQYWTFIRKRYLKILVPYWAFALTCASLTIIHIAIVRGINLLSAITIILSWLIPIDKQIATLPYLTWALWFIPVYLSVIAILPALKRASQSTRKREFGILLLALFIVTDLLGGGWIQNISFYGFWTYIGLFFSKINTIIKQKKAPRCFTPIIMASITALFILSASGRTLDMQINKFPPNITFLAFSITAMSMLALICPYLMPLMKKFETNKTTNKILWLYANRSTTIFLYQPFAFLITIKIVEVVLPNTTTAASIMKSLLCLILTIPACAGLAAILGKIESKEFKVRSQPEA